MLMVGISPQILLQLVAAFEAVWPLVAQSGKSENLQKLLGLVQLAGKVTLQIGNVYSYSIRQTSSHRPEIVGHKHCVSCEAVKFPLFFDRIFSVEAFM